MEHIGGYGTVGDTDGKTHDVIFPHLFPRDILDQPQKKPDAITVFTCGVDALGAIICTIPRMPNEKKFEFILPTREELQQLLDAATKP